MLVNEEQSWLRQTHKIIKRGAKQQSFETIALIIFTNFMKVVKGVRKEKEKKRRKKKREGKKGPCFQKYGCYSSVDMLLEWT